MGRAENLEPEHVVAEVLLLDPSRSSPAGDHSEQTENLSDATVVEHHSYLLGLAGTANAREVAVKDVVGEAAAAHNGLVTARESAGPAPPASAAVEEARDFGVPVRQTMMRFLPLVRCVAILREVAARVEALAVRVRYAVAAWI
jgi:hypothetical protein